MRIEHMREFVAIREEGNFSRAARSLFMAQPALSRHVQEVERELGVRLLNRDKHSVSLTDAGERAYKGFRQILRAYDRLTDDITSYKAGLTGRLCIGMLYYTIRQDFGDAMERFAADYPGVELRRYSYQPQEVFQALAEERIDVGVLPRANYPGSATRTSFPMGSRHLSPSRTRWPRATSSPLPTLKTRRRCCFVTIRTQIAAIWRRSTAWAFRSAT